MPKIYQSNTVDERVINQSTDQIQLSTVNPVAPYGTTNTNDFGSFAANTQINWVPIFAGDIVVQTYAEVTTAITGPTGTPTFSIGISSGSATALLSANSAIAKGVFFSSTPYVAPQNLAANSYIVIDLEPGGGNGAAATAGVIRAYVEIIRASARAKIQS